MLNPPALLRWNSDKAYLAELGRQGRADGRDATVDALDEAALAAARAAFGGELVIKPPVSASADGTFRLGPGDAIPDSVRGRRMLIQPFMPSIADEGEYSLMLFGGEYQPRHRQAAQGRRFPRPAASWRNRDAVRAARRARSSWRSAALAAAPAAAAYARVDMVADDDGELLIMELELIEPALWLQHAPDGGAAFAPPRSAQRSSARNEQPLADRRGQIGRAAGASSRSTSIRAISALSGTLVAAPPRLQRRPEDRLQADRGFMPGDRHRALRSADAERHQYMCWPPLIDSVDPVTKPACSSTRKATPRAISLGLAEAVDRDLGDDLAEHVRRDRRDHVGVDIARRDGVDGDAVARAFLGQRLGEAVDARLGGGIIDLAVLAGLAVDRADVDDPAVAARLHAFEHRLGHVEAAAEIGVDDLLPLLVVHALHRRVAGDPGIVDQHVDRAEVGFDLRATPSLARFVVGDVEFIGRDAGALG